MRAFLILGAFLASVAMVQAEVNTAFALTTVSSNAVYIPDGFDDNDQTLVVIEGSLASTCYQMTSPEIVRDPAAMTVAITAKANVNSGNCAPTPVPFNQEVDLGALSAGVWKVSVAGIDGVEELHVGRSSTTGPDDYIYAPVERVRAEKEPVTGAWHISLRGKISVNCLEWKEARLLVQSRVLVVLPILEQTSPDCLPSSVPFEREVTLPADLPEGRYLVHVRALNGRAINTVFDYSK